MYRAASTSQRQLENERAAVCNSHASRLTAIVADTSDVDLRTRVKLLTDQFVSQMCLGTPAPVELGEADRCWAETGKESCYRPVAEKLQPVFVGRGWK